MVHRKYSRALSSKISIHWKEAIRRTNKLHTNYRASHDISILIRYCSPSLLSSISFANVSNHFHTHTNMFMLSQVNPWSSPSTQEATRARQSRRMAMWVVRHWSGKKQNVYEKNDLKGGGCGWGQIKRLSCVVEPWSALRPFQLFLSSSSIHKSTKYMCVHARKRRHSHTKKTAFKGDSWEVSCILHERTFHCLWWCVALLLNVKPCVS